MDLKFKLNRSKLKSEHPYLLGTDFYVKHEGLHLIYFSYGHYGRKLENYISLRCQIVAPPVITTSGTLGIAQSDVSAAPKKVANWEEISNKNLATNPHIIDGGDFMQDNMQNISGGDRGIKEPSYFRPWMLAKKKRFGGPTSEICE